MPGTGRGRGKSVVWVGEGAVHGRRQETAGAHIQAAPGGFTGCLQSTLAYASQVTSEALRSAKPFNSTTLYMPAHK